jgi:hypothetical protein
LFVATPPTRQLAAHSLEAYHSPEKLLKYIDQHYRLWERGGVKADLHRLDSLIPYLSLLEQSTIRSFWDFCNRTGYYTWRRTYLDKVLSSEDRKREGLDTEGIYSSLDAEANSTHPHSGYWLERVLQRGESVEWAVRVAVDWVRERRSLRAFQYAASIVVSAGTRADLGLLEIKDIEPASAVKEIIANSRFALFRRSLN